MIYILLKSQDVSKLNTKENIPVEFPNSKRDYKMLSQTSQCFLSLKNDLKVREPLEFHLKLRHYEKTTKFEKVSHLL